MENQWQRYYAATQGADPPRPTLLAALDAWNRPPGVALDLGCGAGRDTLPLLAAGWTVHAVDAEPAALARLRPRVAPADRSRLVTVEARFETLDLPPCDLANSSFALPFCAPDTFPALWARIGAALRPGGLFCGQLFGERDAWAGRPGMTFHARTEVETLLAGWERIRLDEEEVDGQTAVGAAKHWHIFHLVARRP